MAKAWDIVGYTYRADERTFDSWDFPKVIFSSQVEDAEY